MTMAKILLCGDSFGVAQDSVSGENQGWPSLLAQSFTVTNLAQAGVGEYKILEQVKSANLALFDCVIVCHTSPNRVHIAKHPMHKNSTTHRHADLIYSDVVWHLRQNPSNKVLAAANHYFIEIYDQAYYEEIYRLLQQEIRMLLSDHKSLHLVTLYNHNKDLFEHCLDLTSQFDIVPGEVNHYPRHTNQKIYELVRDWISQNV